MAISKHSKPIAEENINHLLLIRLSAMGDVAMIIPVISALSQQYPNLKITVLTRAFFQPMFSQFPNVVVFEADVKGRHKGIKGLWKLYKELKTLGIEGVADLHNVLRSNILKVYFSLTKIPFVQINKGRSAKKALITAKGRDIQPLKTTHQRYADVLNALGFSVDVSNVIALPQRSISPVTQQLVEADTKKWIGIAPFAAFEGKMYPLALMKQVIAELNTSKKYKILCFGGGSKEKEQLELWAQEFEFCMNMAGKVSFSEELALISQLDMMLAMDSGNAHLAAMFGIPTITLWGITHPYAGFAPFGQSVKNRLLSDRKEYPLIPTSIYGNKCPKGYENAMSTISPEQIMQKINEVSGS